MGLTNMQQQLIRDICASDMVKAKKTALNCLMEDTTVKNKRFCEWHIKQLKNNPSFIELPMNIKGFAVSEDVSMFNENRYYISSREQIIVDQIRRISKVGEKMHDLGIPYINSTLLHGESGTGKTTLAKYIAKSLKLPFIYLNFSNLIDSLMGKTSNNISKVFQYANENKCVLMLDEIDAISIKRSSSSSGGADGEVSRITISLMQEFDKLNQNIVLLSATNRFDRIDEALLRRFTINHKVDHLNEHELKILHEMYVCDIGIKPKLNVDYATVTQHELIKLINNAISKEVEKSVDIEDIINI